MTFDLRSLRQSRHLLGALGLTLALVLCLLPTMFTPVSAQAEPTAIHGTTIVVDTIDDLNPTSLTETCNFTQFTFVAAGDGCTLRRALLEASAVPQADRPVTITFNLTPSLAIDGVWTLPIEEPLRLFTSNDTNGVNNNGAVTIDGDTQPGGRTDGPKIMLDTTLDNSLIVDSENNIIRNLAFKGGGIIQFATGSGFSADGNTVSGIWMGLTNDGQSIHFREPGNENRLAGGGILVRTDNNIIENNTIAGAFADAIRIDGGDNNIIRNNQIGTRADGTVPDVPAIVLCTPSFDAQQWYGGWGISLSGSNNQILDNRIAGLQNIRGENETAPIALNILGADHTISGNIIGIDGAGKAVGVCGQGIQVSALDTQILNNQITRSRTSFEDDTETAIFGSGGPTSFNRVTVRGNLVTDGPGEVYDFGGNAVLSALRTFNPAKVTGINGANVTGTFGDGSPCDGCLIDLYTDDLDAIGEALTYLGSTTADGDGNWSYTMSSALPADRGIRTSSTVSSTGIITGYGAGTTTKISKLFYGLQNLTINGPVTATVGVGNVYTITAGPVTATVPIDFSVLATDKSPQTVDDANSHQISGSFGWDTPGTKIITATAENDLSVVMGTLEIEVIDPTVALESIEIGGPTSGEINTAYEFTITVLPNNATGPFDYTVNSTDNDPLTLNGSSSRSIVATLSWTTPGAKTIQVTVESATGEMTTDFEITINTSSSSGSDLYMPKLDK